MTFKEAGIQKIVTHRSDKEIKLIIYYTNGNITEFKKTRRKDGEVHTTAVQKVRK